MVGELPEDYEEKLKNLTDPDGESATDQFKWEKDFQRNIIGLLLNDRWFAVQSRDLVRPEYFTDEVHTLLCRIVFDHLDNYKILAPKTFVAQEVLDTVEGKENKTRYHYIAETDLIYEKYVPAVESRDYLLDKITNFAKLQAIRTAFNKCLSILKQDPESDSAWTKVEDLLREALLVDRNFEGGLDYFQTLEERYVRMKEEVEAQEHFTSGFKSIDRALLGGGPHRGEIYSWIGLSGSGKSLALVTGALRNVLELHKRVLYVSLEMDEDKVAERFDAQIANISIGDLQDKKELVKQAMDEFVEDKEDPRMLLIKQFPSGDMSVNKLRAYLQQLYMTGYKPDLLIIDYIGEMKDYPNMPTWESRYRIVRDLRGLAAEEDMCIFTAMQPNKDAREAQKKGGVGPGVIDDTNIADAFGQIRPLDGCWSINQMQQEKEAGVARIFVIKHRHGEGRFQLHVQYDSKTLAITEISKNKYDDIWKKYSFEKEVTVDELEDKTKNIVKDKSKQYFSNDPGMEDPDTPDFEQ